MLNRSDSGGRLWAFWGDTRRLNCHDQYPSALAQLRASIDVNHGWEAQPRNNDGNATVGFTPVTYVLTHRHYVRSLPCIIYRSRGCRGLRSFPLLISYFMVPLLFLIQFLDPGRFFPHGRFRLSSFCASSSKMLIEMRIIKTETQLAKVARVMQTSSTTGSDLFLNL